MCKHNLIYLLRGVRAYCRDCNKAITLDPQWALSYKPHIKVDEYYLEPIKREEHIPLSTDEPDTDTLIGDMQHHDK